MQHFSHMMENITIKRFSIINNPMKARHEKSEITFNIDAIVQPIFRVGSGNVETHRTINHGTYALGDILVITTEDLQDVSTGNADFVIYEGKDYEVTSKKIYKKVIPHFEYTCCLKI
jgi:hypothetical protein